MEGERVAFSPTPAGNPRASVIVATRDRSDRVRATLDALDGQDGVAGAFEVVVVDDGSADDTFAVLVHEWLDRRDAPARIAVRSPRPLGPGAARNLGVRHARAPVLAFLDDDCVPEPDWLANLIAPLASAEVGAVGGAEGVLADQPPLARAAHFALTSPLTTLRVRGGAGPRGARYRPRGFSMAVRRADFDGVGGFPARAHGEDLELAVRLERAGHRLVHEPRARVRHRRRTTVLALWRQAYAMGRARASLVRTSRGHAEPLYFLPPLALLVGTAAGAAALLSPRRPLPLLVGVAAACAYAAVAGVAAARAGRDRALAWRVAVVFLVGQVAYGLGFLVGVVRPERDFSVR